MSAAPAGSPVGTPPAMATITALEVSPAVDGKPAVVHSLLSVPSVIPGQNTSGSGRQSSTFFNIAMFDVSGSMYNYWDGVLDGWNTHVAPVLTGETVIYTFGSMVKFRRRGTRLEHQDNDSSSTNLTGALKVIIEQVEACTHRNIRIFLVTDGEHNCDGSDPEVVISMMTIPPGKVIEVYLLGVGDSFPVQYSVNIRSHFHNGSASCPTIFWSREPGMDMINQMRDIQEEVKKGSVKVSLSIPARDLPYVEETKSECCAGEYLFYDMSPQELKAQLVLHLDNNVRLQISDEIATASASFLVRNLFKQWNAVLIQRHRNKIAVPMEAFELMRKLFEVQMRGIEEPIGTSMKSRLESKNLKTLRTEFSTLMNEGQKMITVESGYRNEIELAEAILKTTVQSKYDTKLLALRGHGDSDWENDTEEFRKKYQSIKTEIQALPPPTDEDCCRIMISSFITDLQDPDFENVLNENKMTFLTNMTFTGIPVFAPVKDSAQINPWTLFVKNICVSPFEILSQRSMESSFAVDATNNSSPDKEIELQAGNPASVFNAIVPIIPMEHCQLLKKLVRTNVFSVGATFCILKSALIVDHNCHFAALGCVWMKTIKDHPAATRPEYIKRRIMNIEETAKLYLDRPAISNYISGLLTKPKLALMTEANEEHDGRTLKCESMVKPAFILHLAKDKIMSRESQVTCTQVLQMILVEFLGRCLSNNTSSTPYMDLLLPDMTTERRQAWINQLTENVLGRVNLTGPALLEACFCPEDVPRHTRTTVLQAVTQLLQEQEIVSLTPSPNMHALVRLRNSGSAGHVGWEDLRAWAQEMAGAPGEGASGAVPLITQEDIEEAFRPDMVAGYVHHALQHRQSRDRFSAPVQQGPDALAAITARLTSERDHFIKSKLLPAVEAAAISKWKESYDLCHRDLARPLTQEQIIQQASLRGVNVNSDNFSQVYKYRPGVGLCRNCCHVESCPHYLKPDRRFNSHLEVERRNPNYPHTLHLVVSQHRNAQAQSLEMVRTGSETGTNNRPKPEAPTAITVDDLRKIISSLDQQYSSMS